LTDTWLISESACTSGTESCRAQVHTMLSNTTYLRHASNHWSSTVNIYR